MHRRRNCHGPQGNRELVLTFRKARLDPEIVLERSRADSQSSGSHKLATTRAGLRTSATHKEPEPSVQSPGGSLATRSILALLLAAGRGSRLSENSSKPLTSWRGKSLVVRSLEPYLEWQSASRATVDLRIVLGFQAEQVAEHLAKVVDQPLKLMHNPDWESGMSSSIRTGLRAVSEQSFDGVLIGLADMPWVSADVLEKLTEQLTPSTIVCPTYDGKRGHPILLGSDFFGEMQEIRGDVGARSLLKKYPECIQLVDVQEPGILEDIDQLSDCPGPLPRVLVLGANELATAVAYCLKQNGFEVGVLAPAPQQLDGIWARLFAELPRYWGGAIPVVVDPDGLSLGQKSNFEVVVDARLLSSQLEGSKPDKTVIGLGPGFKAGLNADAVVETTCGHDLGEVPLIHSVQADNSQAMGSPIGSSKQESEAAIEPRFQEDQFSDRALAVAERVLQAITDQTSRTV